MKNLILIICVAGLTSLFSQKIVTISASEPDTKIYVDGLYMGEGKIEIKVKWNGACKNVKFEKVGYLTKVKLFCNGKNYPRLDNTYYQEMQPDESYDASIKTDVANTDIEITTKKSDQDAWKLIGQIVLSYFDILEVTDRETGYMRTAWIVQQFAANTVRSRVIVKQSSTSPLKYKIKLCSEQSGQGGTSVKEDEKFKEWDRILRKFESLITEMQTRL